jgi:hypothetical protein
MRKELTFRPSRQTSLASLMHTMIPRSFLSQTQQERWIKWCSTLWAAAGCGRLSTLEPR